MYYKNSVGIKAQKEYRSEKNRDNAFALWVILCEIFTVYISPVSDELFSGFVGALLFMATPIIVAVIAVCSTVLYCRAHKVIEKQDVLRAGSKALLIMSLVTLVFIVVVWMKAIIKVNSYTTERILMLTSGVPGPFLAQVPVSVASTIGLLSFLIASAKLKRQSKNINKGFNSRNYRGK